MRSCDMFLINFLVTTDDEGGGGGGGGRSSLIDYPVDKYKSII